MAPLYLSNSSGTDAVGRNSAYILHEGIFTEAIQLQYEGCWKARPTVCGRGRKVYTMASTKSQWVSTALSGSCCLSVWGSETELIVFLFEDCG